MSEKYTNKVEKNTEMSSQSHETGSRVPEINIHSIETENSSLKAELARKNIDIHAHQSEQIKEQSLAPNSTPQNELKWAGKELVSQKYTHTLSSIRNRLKGPEKSFSKVIHQPAVERASEMLENTVARPSGLLFGGLYSFIGSLASYILARRLGGELKLSVFAVFFVGGFFIGLIVELIWRYYSKKRKR